MNSKQKTILILEDDFLNRRLTRKVLTENNYEVHEAKNVDLAKEILAKEKIDLAILDINLGENERNGISLGKQIQKDFQVPFIYLTAYDNPQIIGEAIRTSPYSYLTKPFKNSDLIAAVEIALLNSKSKTDHELCIQVKDGEYKVELAIGEINHIESEGNYLLIHTDYKIYKCRSTIAQIIEILPNDSFIQTHRAFVVNKNKIEKFDSETVSVKTTSEPISKKYEVNVK